MAEWGIWDIIGFIGAVVPALAVLFYLFPRKAIKNFYIDAHRDAANRNAYSGLAIAIFFAGSVGRAPQWHCCL